MKSSRLPFVVAAAVTLTTLGAAPVGAEPVPGAPPAFIYASGGASCANRSFSDCEMLHLKVGLVKADTPAGTTVLLGLGSIAAIVLGCIALSQLRRTGEDGRLLAIWAIVLGAITLVGLIAATIAGIAMIVTVVEQAQSIAGF